MPRGRRIRELAGGARPEIHVLRDFYVGALLEAPLLRRFTNRPYKW